MASFAIDADPCAHDTAACPHIDTPARSYATGIAFAARCTCGALYAEHRIVSNDRGDRVWSRMPTCPGERGSFAEDAAVLREGGKR
jgi:hypothetical protein